MPSPGVLGVLAGVLGVLAGVLGVLDEARTYIWVFWTGRAKVRWTGRTEATLDQTGRECA